MDTSLNPFYAFSFIAAPAVLTNASSILTLSTSNRLARAVDQTRELATELERLDVLLTSYAQDKLRELESYQKRMMMLIRALRSFYVSLGSFAGTTLLALIGAILATQTPLWVSRTLEIATIAIAFLAVGAMAQGAALLVRETHIAVYVLTDRSMRLQEDIQLRQKTPPTNPT